METSSFSAEAWNATAKVREAIDGLPFVRGLGDGSLARERFTYYLAQDAHYLDAYARALAAAAVKAESADDLAFFARSAHDAIVVEMELHRRQVSDVERYEPSATCVGYTSYLLGVAHTRDYPELVAAVLPCFWIYQDVGTRLLDRAAGMPGGLAEHPYGDWIGTYADEAFAASTRTVCAVADRLAAAAEPRTVDRMHAAFARSSRWEWAFWDAAWRRETWPV